MLKEDVVWACPLLKTECITSASAFPQVLVTAIFPDITQGSNMTFAAVGPRAQRYKQGYFLWTIVFIQLGVDVPFAHLPDDGIENAWITVRQDLICYRAVRGQKFCLVGWKFIVGQGWILGLSLVQYLLVLESHLSDGTVLTLGLIHQPANLVESQQTGFLFLPSFSLVKSIFQQPYKKHFKATQAESLPKTRSHLHSGIQHGRGTKKHSPRIFLKILCGSEWFLNWALIRCTQIHWAVERNKATEMFS